MIHRQLYVEQREDENISTKIQSKTGTLTVTIISQNNFWKFKPSFHQEKRSKRDKNMIEVKLPLLAGAMTLYMGKSKSLLVTVGESGKIVKLIHADLYEPLC